MNDAFVYVAPNARAVGVSPPGVPASPCVKRKCTVHTADWREKPGSPGNLHRVTACYVRTSLAELAAARYRSEAHYVTYALHHRGEPLACQPRLTKGSLSWVRAQGYDVVLTALTADVDTPGHVLWTPDTREAFDDLWRRAPGPFATCGVYLSPKGYRLIQLLATPLPVEDGERALVAWLGTLVDAGAWESVLAVHDWTRNMRTPNHLRGGAQVVSPWQDWSRCTPIDVEVPAAAPSRPTRARSTRVVPVVGFDDAVPPGWETVADQLGAAIRDHVRVDWRRCYLALAGALCARGCPPEGVPAVIARAHLVDPEWAQLVGDRIEIARTTVVRWTSNQEVLGYTALRERWAAVADVLDACTTTGAEARVLRQLAAPAPPPIPVAAAVARIAQEIREAGDKNQGRRVVAIEAPPGTGKTHGVVEQARRLPVIGHHAKPGARLAVSAPRHDLAQQTASKLPGSLHLFSPPSLVRDGKPVCAYAESAKHFANGHQSVRRELCNGRGKHPCELADDCDAREGIEGDPKANLVVGVHGLIRELRTYAGTEGTLVVDEPGEAVLTERVTLDDLETAARYLDSFVSRYQRAIAPALAALTAWVREVGALEGPLVTIQDAIRAAAPTVPAELLDAIEVDPSCLGESILVAAAGAVLPDGRTLAPPLEWRAVMLARANAGRAAELGRASRLLDLLWRAIVAKTALPAARLDERNGERAATVVLVNPDLRLALEHEGSVVILDANAGLHLDAIACVLGHAPKHVAIAVDDGAPIRRTILVTGSATRRVWLPRGVPDWSAIVPALRAALAWAREEAATRKVALITPKEVHVGVAYTLRPEDAATLKLAKESRVTRRTLDQVRALLTPVLGAFGGQLVTGHYGALEGLDHMADCDATVTLGDPRPNLGDEQIKAEYLGLNVDGRLDALAAAELQQAHGRLRTIHRTRPGRQLHVGGVVPWGWRDVEVRRFPLGRPRTPEGTMTGAGLRAAREAAQMGVRELARALGVSDGTVRRYEANERAIPDDVATAVRALVPSAPETPSKYISYLGVSGAVSVNCDAKGVSGAPSLQGVSGAVSVNCDATPPDDDGSGGGGTPPRRARRIDLASILARTHDTGGGPTLRAANDDGYPSLSRRSQ